MAVLLLSTLAAAAPLAECARTFTAAELCETADQAEAAFANQQVTGFAGAAAEVHARLACVSSPLGPTDVVRVHRVVALGAFIAQDEPKMRASIGAMVLIDVQAVFPEAVVPAGHRLALLVDEVAGGTHSSGAPLRQFSDGWVEVNGVYAANVDIDLAATLQRVDQQGGVIETRFWSPGESLADWAAPEEGAVEVVPPKRSAAVVGAAMRGRSTNAYARKEAPVQRVVFGIATGGVLLASGLVYGLAVDAKAHALDPLEPEASAQAYRAQANGLTWGWLAGSVVSTGLAATLVITW